MKYTNKIGLPDSIFQAVTNDPYSSGASDISVTRLISPPQLVELSRRHADEITEDVADRLWSLYGQAVHAILERANSKDIKESRLFATVGKWVISGQFDNLALTPEGILSDYKMTSVWTILNGKKPEWVAQLNVLCWLARQRGYQIDRLEIVALLKDWRKAEARRDPNYPQVPAKVVTIPMWSPAEQEIYIAKRVVLHQAARKGTIPPCTDEERWATERTIAVMKGDNKRATKCFTGDNAEAEATLFILDQKDAAKMRKEVRPRQYRRCEDYCPAADFCPQWQADKNS